ncbi:MAG: family 20 glycosylhydrolase [Bacteroides sp.]|nr:family 20 glycosylhydrolase [Bacteroides sp.]
MRYIYTLVCFLLLCTAGLQADNLTQSLLVPYPAQIVPGTGTFRFSSKTTFAVENEEQAAVVRPFIDLFARTAGFSPRIKVDSRKGDICLTTDTGLQAEAYELEITAKKIQIRASGTQGFFYALQSIRQLLPADIDGQELAKQTEWTIPAVSISDHPRFGYRGLMMDVARFFTPKEHLLRIIDVMAMLKLNKLHLHMVDDNGWRIEIKKYPLLTEVGSRRVERPGLCFPERHNARQGEPTVEKGFYTQDDIREIVKYAQERFIEVIPEIEMPAHSNAALASYPMLACPVVDKYIGVLPGLGGNHADIIFCAGNDSVFSFLQDILDEVMALFPSKYIHLGGDEAWKTHWKECPLCQARIKQENLTDEEALQGYFMGRMARYVQSKGREVIGWDELTNSQIPENAIVLGWQGYGQAALKAAKLGHRIIMSPARIMYLIRYQGPQWFEPLTYFGNNTLKDVYTYEAVKKDWTPEFTSLLMGLQASLWTEFCNSTDDVDYLLFPRLSALAEAAWSLPAQKDWNRYLKALDSFNEHIALKGFTYARSMYNIQHTVTPKNGQLRMKLECIRPDVEIRYTTDGQAPTAQSSLYTNELTFTSSTMVKAATFANGEQMGKTLELPIQWNKATAKPVQSKGNDALYMLTNGVQGSLKYTDSEWCTWLKNDSIGFTLDLTKKEAVNKLTLGSINNYGMGIHKPTAISVWTSTDNRSYQKVSEQTYTRDEIFRKGTFREDIPFEIGEEVRYIRIIARGAGSCPATHVRPGQDARMYFDEIIVE